MDRDANGLGAFPDRDEDMTDHKVADWAVDRLSRKSDKPFFLGVGFVRPHVPFYAPQKWLDLFPLEKIKLPPVLMDDLSDVPETSRRMHELPKYPNLDFLRKNEDEQFRKCVRAYLACIAFVDHQVGRVLDALDQGPHAEDTTIILFSDHGYHIGEKDRVSKHSLWEESTRVPLVVVPAKSQASDFGKKGDDLLETGRVDRSVSDHARDVRLAGERKERGNEPGPPFAGPVARVEVCRSYDLCPAKPCPAFERFRYLRMEDGSEEFYDHRTDPNEWTNLAGKKKYAKEIKEFRSALPENDAPYHPSVRSAPTNAWFKEHLSRNGLK